MEIKPEIEANLRQMDRRDFCRRTGCAAVNALALRAGSNAARASADSSRIAFNTANLVARVTNYRYQLTN